PADYRPTPNHDTRGPAAVIVTFYDITERVQAEALERQRTATAQLLQAIAVAANEASTVQEALQACLDQVCAHTGWPVGHAYLLDAAGELVPSGVWHLADPARFGAFREVTERTPLVAGQGLPGQVLATGKAVWLPDVTESRNFPRA